MLLISKTIERYEAHEEGEDVCEPDERGFVYEDEPYTFREVVGLLRYGEPSSWPTDGDIGDWVTHYGEMDMHDGSHEVEAFHYSRSNPPRNAKWWRLAFKAAGLLKHGPHR